MTPPRPAPFLAAAVLVLGALVAGCSMGSRRIRPGDYPSDPRLDCILDDRHVLLFLVDGCREDLLREMVARGELPAIRRYLVARGASADCAVSTVPSVTNACIAAATCGVYPGRLGAPGNRWYDRDKSERISVFGLHDYYRIEEYLSRPTIYEILSDEPTVALFTRCPRGSTYHIPFYYNLIAMKYYLAGNWAKVDEAFLGEFDDLVDCANRDGVFPRFAFFHLTGYDSVAHRAGPFSAEAKALLRNVDRGLGRIAEALERNGALDRVCLMLTADHGHVVMEKKNCLLLEEWFPARTGLPALDRYTRIDRSHDARKRRRLYDRFAVIVANNGRNADLHLRRNPAETWIPPERMAPWNERPSWEELRHYPAPRGPVDLIEALRRAPGVGFVAGRPRNGEIALFSPGGESRIRTVVEGGETRFSYAVVEGDDPLGYGGTGAAASLCDGRFRSSREWLEATCGLDFPDIVAQLPSLFEDRSRGDLYLVAADGWDFEETNISSHGGFQRDEMRIPLLVAGPRIRKGTFGPVRLVDLVPTILDYLGHGDRARRDGLDGVSFLEEISAP